MARKKKTTEEVCEGPGLKTLLYDTCDKYLTKHIPRLADQNAVAECVRVKIIPGRVVPRYESCEVEVTAKFTLPAEAMNHARIKSISAYMLPYLFQKILEHHAPNIGQLLTNELDEMPEPIIDAFKKRK